MVAVKTSVFARSNWIYPRMCLPYSRLSVLAMFIVVCWAASTEVSTTEGNGCKSVAAPEYGGISNIDGDVVTFRCFPGFTLNGAENITCDWENSSESCCRPDLPTCVGNGIELDWVQIGIVLVVILSLVLLITCIARSLRAYCMSGKRDKIDDALPQRQPRQARSQFASSSYKNFDESLEVPEGAQNSERERKPARRSIPSWKNFRLAIPIKNYQKNQVAVKAENNGLSSYSKTKLKTNDTDDNWNLDAPEADINEDVEVALEKSDNEKAKPSIAPRKIGAKAEPLQPNPKELPVGPNKQGPKLKALQPAPKVPPADTRKLGPVAEPLRLANKEPQTAPRKIGPEAIPLKPGPKEPPIAPRKVDAETEPLKPVPKEPPIAPRKLDTESVPLKPGPKVQTIAPRKVDTEAVPLKPAHKEPLIAPRMLDTEAVSLKPAPKEPPIAPRKLDTESVPLKPAPKEPPIAPRKLDTESVPLKPGPKVQTIAPRKLDTEAVPLKPVPREPLIALRKLGPISKPSQAIQKDVRPVSMCETQTGPPTPILRRQKTESKAPEFFMDKVWVPRYRSSRIEVDDDV